MQASLIEHRSIVAFQEILQSRLLSQPGNPMAQFLSPGFDVCLHGITSALCHGATLVLRTDGNDPFSHLKSVDTAVFIPRLVTERSEPQASNIKHQPQRSLSKMEEEVAEEWQLMLNLSGTESTIGTKSNLHVPSGHSLFQLRFYSRLAQRFAVRISVGDVIHTPVLSELANLITSRRLSEGDIATYYNGGRLEPVAHQYFDITRRNG